MTSKNNYNTLIRPLESTEILGVTTGYVKPGLIYLGNVLRFLNVGLSFVFEYKDGTYVLAILQKEKKFVKV